MYKIFLVEDDNVIANQVEKHLSSWNYEVIIAKDFHDIMSDFAKSEADLVLLDISNIIRRCLEKNFFKLLFYIIELATVLYCNSY